MFLSVIARKLCLVLLISYLKLGSHSHLITPLFNISQPQIKNNNMDLNKNVLEQN